MLSISSKTVSGSTIKFLPSSLSLNIFVASSNNILVSASYQGNITAIDLQQGQVAWQEKISSIHDLAVVRSRIIAIDEKDSIKGFGLTSGAILWQQDGLKLRGISSPAALGSNFVVGDFEGYLHALSQVDGHIVARTRLSSDGIRVDLLAANDLILAYSNDGELAAYRLQ